MNVYDDGDDDDPSDLTSNQGPWDSSAHRPGHKWGFVLTQVANWSFDQLCVSLNMPKITHDQ